MMVLLIAGHGGTPYDPGAVGCGYTEAVETRRMANAVAPLLRSRGFEVALYDQREDAYKTVCAGGSLPLAGVSYVLEFHLNAAANDPDGNGKTTGTEIYVHTREAGVTVEEAILRRVCALGFKDRGVKRSSGLAVLKHVFSRGVSHALVETCFIDDLDDMQLYAAKFDRIAQAIANGVAEGFGMPVPEEETESEEEDEDMVEIKAVEIDGVLYDCGCIMKNGENYVRLRDFVQAGYSITYDAKTQTPGVIAPQTRPGTIVTDEETLAALDKVQTACGLVDQTMVYLLKYQYGGELLRKLAAAIQKED